MKNISKDELIQELLNEVKSIKDFTKEELPVITKEYIQASKVKTFFNLCVGFMLCITAYYCVAYVINIESETAATIFASIYGVIGGTVGFIMVGHCITSLIDLYFQPRRIAIKSVLNLTE